jgi:hypothetical protein
LVLHSIQLHSAIEVTASVFTTVKVDTEVG